VAVNELVVACRGRLETLPTSEPPAVVPTTTSSWSARKLLPGAFHERLTVVPVTEPASVFGAPGALPQFAPPTRISASAVAALVPKAFFERTRTN
jgi:hypothetical protein